MLQGTGGSPSTIQSSLMLDMKKYSSHKLQIYFFLCISFWTNSREVGRTRTGVQIFHPSQNRRKTLSKFDRRWCRACKCLEPEAVQVPVWMDWRRIWRDCWKGRPVATIGQQMALEALVGPLGSTGGLVLPVLVACFPLASPWRRSWL